MALVESSLSLAPAPQSDYMDDTAIRRKRLLAEQLMQQGADTSPIRSPWQGAARLVQGLMGGLNAASADAAEKDNADYNSKLLAGLLAPQASAEGGVSPAPQSPATLTPSTPPVNGSVAPKAANSDLLPAFAQAGTRWGVSPDYLTRTAQIESGMNPNAKNPSGAAGLMQLVPSTAKAYNLFNPFDPNASIDAAGHLAADNKRTLVAALHRDPSDAELYLAHQQGASGAAKLLAHPDALAASIVGEKAVLQNGGKPGMTARDFAGMWINKFGGAPAGGAPSPGPQMADVSGGVPAAPAAPSNTQAQRILAALSDPRLSPQNKQMLMLMYQNATKDENRTRYSEPTTDAQGNLIQRDSNGQVHVLRAAPTDTKPSFEQEYTDKQGNIVQRDSKGQLHLIRAAPTPSGKQSLDEQIAERRKVGEANGLKGEDLQNYALTGKLPTNADKAPTGEQSNAANFATRMREAEKIISDPSLMDAVTPTQNFLGGLPVAGNYLTSDHYKSLDQAKRDFVNATLRRESGASISPAEFENANKQYFPQPGDPQSVIEQKMRNRQTAMEGIANAGAPSFREQFFGERNPNIVKRADERSDNASKPKKIIRYDAQGNEVAE